MLFDFAELDLCDKGNLYFALYEKIKNAVEMGAVKKGEKLPSVREAAALLGVSRTTVENAYGRLCIEGIAESMPQRGYYIIGANKSVNNKTVADSTKEENIKYDFSSRKIDSHSADTEIWKKMVRQVLWDSGELTSYGDNQGEAGLRSALASYAYKARGVKTSADNIIIGAGIGPLLNILCGLIGRDMNVGFENGGFTKAQSVFSDYGIKSLPIASDANGAMIDKLYDSNANVLFLMPSALSKISVTALSKRRNEYVKWVASGERLIIEDDYNGELRYTARTVPAFQSKAVENTVYIGSFSKLLLPSVRIAYMVLPERLMKRFKARLSYFNQTCGKIEQLALEKYISSGALEKHLRRLRRLYYNKSQVLISCLESEISSFKAVTLYESSLSVELETGLDTDSGEICKNAERAGLRLMESPKKGCIRLSFAGIAESEIPIAVKELEKSLKSLEISQNLLKTV